MDPKKSAESLVTFLKESWQEVRYKVTWPNRKEVWGTTLVVLVTTIVFATYLGILDFSMLWLVEKVFARFA